MKKPIFVFGLLILQIWLCFGGVDVFGFWVNPFLFFFVSIAIAGFYFHTLTGHREVPGREQHKTARYDRYFLIALVALLSVCFILYIGLFRTYWGTYIYSDVIPQLDALYDRCMRGEQPYYPVTPPVHSPFPVYMPLHWLPIGFARLSGIDLRLIGLLMLCIAIVIYGFYFIKKTDTVWGKTLVTILPVLVLMAFYNRFDLIYVFETPIAAYYLVLALGLARRDLPMIIIGIICCLLSRYTMVFWLPLFAVLLWINSPWRRSLLAWASVAVAVLLIYVIPFYLRAPSALAEGIRYHNTTVVKGWTSDSSILYYGFYFAPHLRALFSGDIDHRVLCARILQASVMLLLFAGGLLGYWRISKKVNFYDFSLGMLYLVLLCFYEIGPVNFRYYLISFFFVTVVLCARMFQYMANSINSMADL